MDHFWSLVHFTFFHFLPTPSRGDQIGSTVLDPFANHSVFWKSFCWNCDNCRRNGQFHDKKESGIVFSTEIITSGKSSNVAHLNFPISDAHWNWYWDDVRFVTSRILSFRVNLLWLSSVKSTSVVRFLRWSPWISRLTLFDFPAGLLGAADSKRK